MKLSEQYRVDEVIGEVTSQNKEYRKGIIIVSRLGVRVLYDEIQKRF
ncbi:hypothetical protein [Priestia megaterium]